MTFFGDEQFNHEVTAYVNLVCENSHQCIHQIKQIKLKDESCQQLMKYYRDEWPDKRHVT